MNTFLCFATPSVLVKQGIVVKHRDQGYGPSVHFSFTKLNDIKPGMVREDIANARKAAGQFAKDSGSKVGNIRHAHQGRFSIIPIPNLTLPHF